MDPATASSFCYELNVTLAQNQDQTLITHHNMANRSNDNQLDYIASNLTHDNTNTLPQLQSASDHVPLVTSLRLPISPKQAPQPRVCSFRLKKDIRPSEIAQILQHQDWPRKPFIEVANRLTLTTKVYRSVDDLQNMTKLVNNILIQELLSERSQTFEFTSAQLKENLELFLKSRSRNA